jgi:hypothetical protein
MLHQDRGGYHHSVHPAVERQEGDGLVCYVGLEPVVVCSVCETVIPVDPRGDVLDASGRCQECQP